MPPVSSYSKFLFAGLLLVTLGIFVVRLTPKSAPAPEEARVEWTYLRQTPLRGQSAAMIEGTSSTRQSLIKVIGKTTQLLLEEADIVDPKKLEMSLQMRAVTKTTVAGRDGYLVPVSDISGGSGLLLVGESTTLLLQDVHAAHWPRALEPDVLAYLRTVQVP